LLWAGLIASGLARADAPAPEAPGDYAQHALLQTEGEAAWYRLDVPMSVYWSAAHADLRDLRVFNAAGETLPYALTATQERRAETRLEIKARFFPLYGTSRAGGQNDATVRVRRDASGLLVEVLSDPAQKPEPDAPLRGWLLEVSADASDKPLESLRLDWKDGPKGFQRFRIDASNDLERWNHWGEGQIARLEDFDGERIERKEVRLRGGKARYLRLTWLSPETAPVLSEATLTGVRADFEAAPLLWSEAMPGQRAGDDKSVGEFTWQLPLSLPLERIHIALAEPNTLAPVIVSGARQTEAESAESARNKARQTPRVSIGSLKNQVRRSRDRQSLSSRDIWQPLARGLLYRLPLEGGEDVQEEIGLPGVAVKQLRLQIDPRGGGLNSEAPQLRVAMSGHQLVFLARGAPPYQLAFGRADARSAVLPLSTLAPGYDSRRPEKTKFGIARLAEPDTAVAPAVAAVAAAAAVTSAAVEENTQGKTYALWAALLAGIALLSGMAVSLLRAEKKPGSGES
jgi:hypothetical protein